MRQGRKRRTIVAPRQRRRRRAMNEDDEIEAEALVLGPGDKPSGDGGR
jgi:hypothetical protein